MFKSTLGKGFQMSFENGLTVSVQWGPGNYCKNYSKPWDTEVSPMRMNDCECKNAEVAVWRTADEVWLNAGDFVPESLSDAYGSDVVGWLSADEVAEVINAVKNYPSPLDRAH